MTDPMEPSRADFCHPYQPYDIQLQFMSNLYQCIDRGQVGIFESPTGTGKSLSLICGAMTWLRDHKRRALDETAHATHIDDETPEWMRVAEQNERRKYLLQHRQKLEIELAKVRKDKARRHAQAVKEPYPKRQRLDEHTGSAQPDSNEDQYMLADYESGGEEQTITQRAVDSYSASTQALLEKLKGAPASEEEDTDHDETKIFFCSRTHSQLTQFVNELRRVKPPRGLPQDSNVSVDESIPDEVVKHLSLGSRKNLCINPKVASLGSAAAINERCLELQKPGTAKDHKCSFLPNKDSKSLVEGFRNRALAHIQDIEDLGKLGRALQICPYYASRSAIASSEIVTLPYPLLLQKSAREALGICLKDNVIVIDEAHNLMDAIAGLFSVSLSLKQLETSMAQVRMYAQRFMKKLKGKNRVYVSQVIRLLSSITKCVLEIAGNGMHADQAVTPAQLMSGEGCDQIKPHKLMQYLQDSKLAYKVEGYVDAKQDGDAPKDRGVLLLLQSFLIVLMNPASEGRFFVKAEQGHPSVRYALLDPTEHFRDVVEEARAVILAGGTMSPMSDYTDFLFSYLSTDRLVSYSFGHVIPSSNLLTQAIVHGPSGKEFLFNYAGRTDAMYLELRLLLERTCTLVPDGVVVFFPSYDTLAQVVAVWARLAGGDERLRKLKPVFSETRNAGVEDNLLQEYTKAIDAGTGAVLLAVVGGKLSEGINFSDKLGRAVVAVGLPFANINDAELKAKLLHVAQSKHDTAIKQRSLTEVDSKALRKAAEQDFYTNACMRAVNQCIGRAIRHKNDYAAILLVDSRFATERIESRLPGWIRANMEHQRTPKSWADTEVGLKNFFAAKA